MKRAIATCLIIFFDHFITRVYNASDMLISGQLATNQLNASDLDFVIQQTVPSLMGISHFTIHLITLFIIIAIWLPTIKSFIKKIKSK